MLDPKVFKAYDVRGIYPTELDEDGAYAIGRAYIEQFQPRRIAVGRDMRISSPSMATALIRGATEAGADVLDLGLVGTEMVYFAVGELELDGGVAVGVRCPSAGIRACWTSGTERYASKSRTRLMALPDRFRSTTSGRPTWNASFPS